MSNRYFSIIQFFERFADERLRYGRYAAVLPHIKMPTARVLARSRLKCHRVWLAYSRAGIEETQIFGSSATDTGQR